MTPRRQWLWALVSALTGWVAARSPSQAQSSNAAVRRVGIFAPSTAAKESALLKLFFDEMHQLGWVEGQNIAYDRVFADDQHEALPRLAAELVARKPEVIFAPPTGAALAAKLATPTIPIVFGFVYDPVGIGLVTSLARPGGNVTGVVTFSESLAPKRIELLREILPAAKRLALLGDTNDASVKALRKGWHHWPAQRG